MEPVYALEMCFTGEPPVSTLTPVPYDDRFRARYRTVYNACFHGLRASLGIEPADFYAEDADLSARTQDTFLLLDGDRILGAVSCRRQEIDDLIVAPECRRHGYGRALLRWAMARMAAQGVREITLHAAEVNTGAVALYRQEGFTVRQRLRVR